MVSFGSKGLFINIVVFYLKSCKMGIKVLPLSPWKSGRIAILKGEIL